MTLPKLPPDLLSTPRLLLRAPRLGDAPELHAAVHESLAELHPYMRWATPDYTLAEVEANTHLAVQSFAAGEGFRYHFFERASGLYVGNGGFHHLEWTVPKFELGYWCRTRFAGQGYISEAVRALSEMAEQRLGAARLEIRCDVRNRRSARVAEACGYALEGTLRCDTRDPEGMLRDTLLYARIAADHSRYHLGNYTPT